VVWCCGARDDVVRTGTRWWRGIACMRGDGERIGCVG
jgi:hypothetical protein